MGAQAARMAAGGGDVPAEQAADLRALAAGEELELPAGLPRLFG